MLQRGHSDFAWFRERAESLHSNSLSHYTEMASTTIDGQGQLNPEPSQPDERAEHNLLPKSYADAAANQGANGTTVEPASDRNGKGTVNGSAHPPATKGDKSRRKLDEDKVIFEKHVNNAGEILTSIKPSEQYEESLKHDGQTAPREKKPHRPTKRQDLTQDELSSGRKAGAGWERSA
jgi:hypothetical protein